MNALRRWAPMLAVGILLAAAWATAALSSPELNNLPVPPLATATSLPTGQPASGEQAPASPDPEDRTQVEMPDETSGIISIVALIIVVVAGGMVTWVLVRKRVFHTRGGQLVVQRRSPARRRSRPEDVVEAINAGLSELADLEADPRGAVIACWVRLEAAAALAGTPRRPADSPTDLVGRLLASHNVSPDVLEGFAVVYREARFAAHPIAEEMRPAALDALRQIRSELGQRTGSPPEPPAPAGGDRAEYAAASHGGGDR